MYQWRRDGIALGGAEESSLVLADLQPADAGFYDVIVVGAQGSVTSRAASLGVGVATADTDFNAGFFSDAVRSIAAYPDGRILVGGSFTSVDGQPCPYIVRLHADGSPDPTFVANPDGAVNAIVIQPDGTLLLGGAFFNVNGLPHPGIVRLLPDGSVDLGFALGPDPYLLMGQVHALAVQPDGRILAGGYFLYLNGYERYMIARLNADGSLDTSFPEPFSFTVQALALQPDGGILVGGRFSGYLARLGPDGTRDPTFAPDVSIHVTAILEQPDGCILAASGFDLLRFTADGQRDASFNPLFDGSVDTMALQTDGSILVGGTFWSVNGVSRRGIARLLADGSLDPTFVKPATADTDFLSLALLADGSVLAGGEERYGAFSQKRGLFAKLRNGPAASSLQVDGEDVTWLRRGTAPEVWRTALEHSADGLQWSALASGTRIAGGWRFEDAALEGGTLRALGRSRGGYFTSSESIVSEAAGAPAFVNFPKSCTNNAETTAILFAHAEGSAPLHFRWHKDGEPLTDDGNRSGCMTRKLQLSDVSGADSGMYVLVADNPFGIATSTVAVVTVVDPVILVNPAAQRLDVGQDASLSVVAAGTELRYQWRHNGIEVPDATESALALSTIETSDAGNYDVVVGGTYGCVTSTVALLRVNAACGDPNFSPVANGAVRAIAVQPDRRMLVAGDFTQIGGTPCPRLARLNTDGTIDASLNLGTDATINTLAVQPDGGILVGGAFAACGGQPRTRIARITAQGSLDGSFAPSANQEVLAMVVQPDGKIVVGGKFSTLNGQSRQRIGRLNADGTLDETFAPSAGSVDVRSLAVQSDGKILLGGDFTAVSGVARKYIARLHANGSVDAAFAPESDGPVDTIAVQADGGIVLGGAFQTVNGQSCAHIARLHPDGTLDGTFVASADASIHTVSIQANGAILIGGTFTTVNGAARGSIARLGSDGELDIHFDPGADGEVLAVALQTDGQALVGGVFTAIAGHTLGGLARLAQTEPALVELFTEPGRIVWLRAGTAPAVWHTTFERTDNGTDWVPIGAGSRIAGGWQSPGSLGQGEALRARGYTAGGQRGASGGIVESAMGNPAFSEQPSSLTNNAGTSASFSVAMSGGMPVVFQWRKDGVDLTDGGNVSGSRTAMLTLVSVLAADAGAYDVVASSDFGATASLAAWLTVVDPVIVAHPRHHVTTQGSSVTLAVEAAGTPPLTYQWRKDGDPVPHATAASFTLPDLQPSDAGCYDVVVCGPRGRAASQMANVSLVPELKSAWVPDANGTVHALAVQPDGKLLVGGAFTEICGTARSRIARLNADATLDASFAPEANSTVTAMAVEPDGGILVGGMFWTLAGQTRNFIARLHADGSLDAAFNPNLDGTVLAIVPQPDGKILLGGAFTKIGGSYPMRGVARVNANGTRDTTFGNPSPMGGVYTLALQSDGKVLLGGAFTTVGGQTRNRIARLNANGTLDSAFNPGASSSVYVLAVLPDGSILVGGAFGTLAGQTRTRLGKLLADGTLVADFDPTVSGGNVNTLALQVDGRMLVGGNFTTVGGLARNRIASLTAGGAVDASFAVGVNSQVRAIVQQANGDIVVAGEFTEATGQARSGIACYANGGVYHEALASDGSTVTWQRAGAAPEVWRTLFEHSADGEVWELLGAGERSARGWQIGRPAVQAGTLRVRGFTVGGQYAGSGGIVAASESVDADADGIPDGWTLKHFGHTMGLEEDLSRAEDDANGTGQSNWFKYVAGLDPNEPTSVFRLELETIPGPPVRARLIFGPRLPSRSYAPLYRDSLAEDDPWLVLSEAEVDDVGTQRRVLDMDDSSGTRFYRLRISYP